MPLETVLGTPQEASLLGRKPGLCVCLDFLAQTQMNRRCPICTPRAKCLPEIQSPSHFGSNFQLPVLKSGLGVVGSVSRWHLPSTSDSRKSPHCLWHFNMQVATDILHSSLEEQMGVGAEAGYEPLPHLLAWHSVPVLPCPTPSPRWLHTKAHHLPY